MNMPYDLFIGYRNEGTGLCCIWHTQLPLKR